MKTETTPSSLNGARARKWLAEFEKGELAWPAALNSRLFALFSADFGQSSIYHLAPQVLSSCWSDELMLADDGEQMVYPVTICF